MLSLRAQHLDQKFRGGSPDAPVSMAVVLRSISILQAAAIVVSHDVIEGGLLFLPHLAAEQRQIFHLAIESQADDVLWLDSVEPGSKKLKGVIRNAIFGGVAGITFLVGKQFSEDVLEKSEVFQQASEATAKAIDAGAEKVATSIHEIYVATGGALANGFEIVVTVKDGTIFFAIHPLETKIDSEDGARRRQSRPG